MFRFFYTSVVIIILAGIVWFGLSLYSHDAPEPKLIFKGPEAAPAGAPFDLEVAVSNESGQKLQDARISLTLPEGVVFLGKSSKDSLSSKKIGDLGIGSLATETFQLMALAGGDDDAKKITASVDYSPELAGSRFKKEDFWEFLISGSALDLDVRLPDQITSGSNLEMKISYSNPSDTDLENLVLAIEYPPSFQYEKSSIKPDSGNNRWELGGLRRGSSNDLSVSGKLIGPENNAFQFKTQIFAELSGQSYLIAEETSGVTTQISPLSLEILANGVSDYTAKPGETILYTISYRYLNRPAGAANGAVKAELKGEMFDLSGLSLKNNTMIWDLRDLGDSGKIEFNARVRDDHPIKRLGDRNFSLVIKAQMDDGKHIAVAESAVKVSSRLRVEARGFFRDASSGIINSGPFPPKINQETDYTIHWLLTNYSNDARDVRMEATLPSYVAFTGFSKSDAGEKPSYHPDGRMVVWEINRLSATRGIISSPAEAIFQIKAVPGEGSEGAYLQLLGETKVTAIDDFTGLPITAQSGAITTQLPDDATAKNDGVVLK